MCCIRFEKCCFGTQQVWYLTLVLTESASPQPLRPAIQQKSPLKASKRDRSPHFCHFFEFYNFGRPHSLPYSTLELSTLHSSSRTKLQNSHGRHETACPAVGAQLLLANIRKKCIHPFILLFPVLVNCSIRSFFPHLYLFHSFSMGVTGLGCSGFFSLENSTLSKQH